MSKYLIIGVEGEESLWVVNCESKTVEQFDADSLTDSDAAAGDVAANFVEARRQGLRVHGGIDLAIASESRAGTAAHPRFSPDRN